MMPWMSWSGGFFAQAFLHTAGGDGFEPLAEVFLEGGLSQQGLDALGGRAFTNEASSMRLRVASTPVSGS
ncbi:MAG: hypothetical protein B7Z37_25665 [Verrucomicrobia bacterium 12-59-8]|nr:MAG: hypothetical protein B7Z37_25665 [Verrucomicrobia bacterium 12-59-8]